MSLIDASAAYSHLLSSIQYMIAQNNAMAAYYTTRFISDISTGLDEAVSTAETQSNNFTNIINNNINTVLQSLGAEITSLHAVTTSQVDTEVNNAIAIYAGVVDS